MQNAPKEALNEPTKARTIKYLTIKFAGSKFWDFRVVSF